MKILTTFSDDHMTLSQDACHKSFMFDLNIRWTHHHLDGQRPKHPTIFQEGVRGAGCYWWFKPYTINQTIKRCEDDTWLIYSDAGVIFLKDPDVIIDEVKEDIIIFGNEHIHSRWCKAEIGEAMGFIAPGLQAQASVIMFKVTERSKEFVSQWLKWCSVPDLINDKLWLPQSGGFIENRHDQAILTQLAYSYSIPLNFWPEAIYGNYIKKTYPKYSYKNVFLHHRYRNYDWERRGSPMNLLYARN